LPITLAAAAIIMSTGPISLARGSGLEILSAGVFGCGGVFAEGEIATAARSTLFAFARGRESLGAARLAGAPLATARVRFRFAAGFFVSASGSAIGVSISVAIFVFFGGIAPPFAWQASARSHFANGVQHTS
jgi:hypothetical protein